MARRCVPEIQDGSLLTGNTNISETMTYIIKIQTATLRHSTMAVYLGDANNDRRSEMAAETVHVCMYISGFDRHVDFLSEWPTFVKFTSVLCRRIMSVVAKTNISIWLTKPEIIISLEVWQLASKFQRQIQDFRWRRAQYKISQTIATTIGYQKWQDWRSKCLHCHLRLSQSSGVSFSSWAWSKTPDLLLKLSSYLSLFQRFKHFQFWRPQCHSCCRSLSQSLGETLFSLAMVENPGLAVGISTLSVVVPVV